ncbi:SMC family ATPase [Streptomyces sp. CAU 1734]|uniref:SMC family ATPase n=1 Tax=Streptomyces sp. CAU 1734 TaxID=3140360 RepID=UPI00325FFA40
MRLHRLAVTAFGPFGAAQEIDFDTLAADGIFLLHGPTGAGKTSVLDAVCFALYGAVPGARQSPGASLRSDHAEPGTVTEVLLELTVAGRRLEIRRQPAQPRPKKRGTGFINERANSWLREYDPAAGGWRALSKSHQEIGEEIAQLIGMSRDQFCQVVLLPQGDFARFLRADAEARGKLLGRLFDTRSFAAVEECLAEWRRKAEGRVRAGDEQLLAGLHRMDEAAGPAGADLPPPRHAPGEPGLASGVLEWAAVARSRARELRDIAESALSAAESRQFAARTALDGVRERERLQSRYADARRRYDETEPRRAGTEELVARLERARKADRVSPALRLRDEAAEEHRTATAGHERVRAGLPRDLLDAGAEQLTELARRARQDLGGLDAARRAERRGAEITRERAELDRQARADDDILRDAAGWLAGWDDLRREHRERVTETRDAATLAEQLAGRVEPARRRLRAARERDGLLARRAGTRERLVEAAGRSLAARESWLDLKERRLLGMAAELAASLTPGTPCAVCGSAEHPAPAPVTGGRVTPAEEESAYQEYTALDTARAAAESELAVAEEALATARAEARDTGSGSSGSGSSGSGSSGSGGAGGGGDGADDPADPSVTELTEALERLEREHREARLLASGAHAAREALDRAEREHGERTDARHQVEQRAAARTSLQEALDAEQSSLLAELAALHGSAGPGTRTATVAERAAELELRLRLLEEAAEAVRTAELTAQRLKEADDRLADAAFRAGFDTPEAAAGARLGDGEQSGLQRRIDAWRTESATVAELLAEDDARAAAALPPADTASARAAHDTAERTLRAALSARDAARDRCTALARLSERAAAEVRELGPRRAEYTRIARLAALTAGTSADNERRMRLESYVLAARLEQVAAAATVRLQRMSSGRYTLVHSDARAGGKRAGLGLHVVDSWTGSERDTSTLSGGETFFASLALALGLADVVTEEAGGVRLDTLFIDEGFGSLDEQTLDEVLDVLDSLRERDRSVGIVSHVADLRRRIPTRLEVVKARHGSEVFIRSAPLSG